MLRRSLLSVAAVLCGLVGSANAASVYFMSGGSASFDNALADARPPAGGTGPEASEAGGAKQQ